jgi:hypothetical protein
MTDEYPDGVFPMGSDDEFDRHPRTATELPFTQPAPDPTRPERPARKCYRHLWGPHEETETPGVTTVTSRCLRCGKPRNEAIAKRNRRNRQRGGAYERQVATALGGRRTGPLGGRDDVIVGELFAIQTKRSQRFALTEARKYLDDLRRTYPTRTPIVAHALPGERGGGVVILTFADWRLLHGSDGTTEEQP